MSKNTPRLLQSFSKFLKSKKVRPFILPAAVAIVAAVVGTFLVTASRAGTNTISAEIENGSVRSPAKEINGVNSASGGGAVAFVKKKTTKSSSNSDNSDDSNSDDSSSSDSGSDSSSSSSSGAKATSGSAFYDKVCSGKVKGKTVGNISKAKKLPEASGIAASTKTPGTFWVENDSGNPNEIYAVKQDGSLVGTLKVGAKNTDWEDIEVRNGSIYISDTGTNKSGARSVHVFKLAEPSTGSKGSGSATTLNIKYAGGGSPNAEALIVDKSGGIWIIDKAKGTSNVWKGSGTSGTVNMTKVGTVNYSSKEVTAADMSPDGTAVVVRTYNGIFVYKTSGDVGATLKTKYCSINFADEHGEDIAFLADNSGLIATGETKDGGSGAMTLFQ